MKATYDYVPIFKDSVDFAGDLLNVARNEISKVATDIGDAWNSSLHAMKGCLDGSERERIYYRGCKADKCPILFNSDCWEILRA